LFMPLNNLGGVSLRGETVFPSPSGPWANPGTEGENY